MNVVSGASELIQSSARTLRPVISTGESSTAVVNRSMSARGQRSLVSGPLLGPHDRHRRAWGPGGERVVVVAPPWPQPPRAARASGRRRAADGRIVGGAGSLGMGQASACFQTFRAHPGQQPRHPSGSHESAGPSSTQLRWSLSQ